MEGCHFQINACPCLLLYGRPFAKNEKDHLCSLGALIFDSNNCEKNIEAVANFYSLDKDALSTDLNPIWDGVENIR